MLELILFDKFSSFYRIQRILLMLGVSNQWFKVFIKICCLKDLLKAKNPESFRNVDIHEKGLKNNPNSCK